MGNNGYADQKEFICTGCGKPIMATKFASQKSIKCDECKANGVPTNPDIVAVALSKNPPKATVHSKSLEPPTGDTKDRPCIKCEKITTVSKFMSDKKVLCNDCKDTGVKPSDVDIDDDEFPNSYDRRDIKVDPSKIDWTQIKPLEEYRINEIIIANKNLQKIKCPACGHEHMKILMVADSSQFGIIANYQCQMCKLFMTVSEQTKQLLKTIKQGRRYNYSGEEMEKLASTMDDTRLSTSVQVLLKLCKDNNISVDGLELPPYLYKDDKPVPIGFVIPEEDKLMYSISSAIQNMKDGNIDNATLILEKLLKEE